MKFFKTLFLLVLTLSSISWSATPKNQNNLEVDTYVKAMMDHHSIPGLALAVIKNDGVIHEAYYGEASILRQEKANEASLWRIYSLTKLPVAAGVFQLVDQGKLSLDDTLSKYFTDLPDKWQRVQIRHLLAHASGLPDIINYNKELENDSMASKSFLRLLYDDKMDFETGSEWRYNQTNFLLLKEIIQQVSGVKFEDYILQNLFTDTKDGSVVFSCDTDQKIANRVECYTYDKKAGELISKPEHKGNKGHPLSGLNLTLNQFINWDQNLSDYRFFGKPTLEEMWEPFKYKDSGRKFLNGWDVYETNGIESYGFSGGGVSGYRKYIHNDLSIILFSNGFKYYPVQNVMIDRIAGIVDEALQDDIAVLTEDLMSRYFISGNGRYEEQELEEIISQVAIDNEGVNLEEVLKSVGYKLFFDLDRKEEAISIFKKNVRLYPDAYDTHGSLGYLYYLTKKYKLAKAGYQKAEALNPNNSYSKRRLKEINEILSKDE